MIEEQDNIERLTLACDLLSQRLHAATIEIVNLQVELALERKKNAPATPETVE